MTKNLFNGPSTTCSLITTGGTESNALAMKAMKGYAEAYLGITNPELLMGLSVHPSIPKACCYCVSHYLYVLVIIRKVLVFFKSMIETIKNDGGGAGHH